MHSSVSRFQRHLAVILVGGLLGALPASATDYYFNNGNGTLLYKDAKNWDLGAVPDLTTANTAHIADGSAVNYVPGGDLTIKNGGVLEITNGSWTQSNGNAYIQLNGGGTILVDGGTFDQGTASSNPFNVTGTGNAFTVNSGTATIRSSFNVNTGLTFLQSGGTINVLGNETDFNGGSSTLSGGVLNTKLITGVNGPAGNTFNISGGQLTLTGSNYRGIYGGGTDHYINFTTNSTGLIDFTQNTGNTTATIQNFISSNVIEYNNTPYNASTGYSMFSITSDGAGGFFLGLAGAAVPEPATFAAGCLLVAFAGPAVFRRLRRPSLA